MADYIVPKHTRKRYFLSMKEAPVLLGTAVAGMSGAITGVMLAGGPTSAIILALVTGAFVVGPSGYSTLSQFKNRKRTGLFNSTANELRAHLKDEHSIEINLVQSENLLDGGTFYLDIGTYGSKYLYINQDSRQIVIGESKTTFDERPLDASLSSTNTPSEKPVEREVKTVLPSALFS
jgi:hypothetical protein